MVTGGTFEQGEIEDSALFAGDAGLVLQSLHRLAEADYRPDRGLPRSRRLALAYVEQFPGVIVAQAIDVLVVPWRNVVHRLVAAKCHHFQRRQRWMAGGKHRMGHEFAFGRIADVTGRTPIGPCHRIARCARRIWLASPRVTPTASFCQSVGGTICRWRRGRLRNRRRPWCGRIRKWSPGGKYSGRQLLRQVDRVAGKAFDPFGCIAQPERASICLASGPLDRRTPWRVDRGLCQVETSSAQEIGDLLPHRPRAVALDGIGDKCRPQCFAAS